MESDLADLVEDLGYTLDEYYLRRTRARELLGLGEIWVLGAGNYAQACAALLKRSKLDLKGFVVDNDYWKPRSNPVVELPVWPLSELGSVRKPSLVIAGVQQYGFDFLGAQARCRRLGLRVEHSWLLSTLETEAEGMATWSHNYNITHAAEFRELRAILGDASSHQVLDGHLRYRLLGELPERSILGFEQYFDLDIDWGSIEHYVDLGAYDGDSVANFMHKWREAPRDGSSIHNREPRVTAVEPDPVSFTRLMHRVDELCLDMAWNGPFRLVQAAAGPWPGSRQLSVTGSPATRTTAPTAADLDQGQQGLHARAGAVESRVTVVLPDEIAAWLGNAHVAFVKFDLEGDEVPLLVEGGALQFAQTGANLAVSVYHREEDLLAVSAVLRKCEAWGKLYLRMYGPDSTDLVLFAIRSE